ncbi:cytosine deaminase [[Eubacterium] tenue]|nr:cytosine deaminase [[Eubacterium] tenue]MBC8630523.1 cytosine deaminase [[Eubacterium] tenue]
MKAKLFKNARLKGNETLVDLFVENGKYKEIGPNLSKKYKDVQTYDLEGNLVVPPYVDPHIHLDYVYTARMDGATNGTGTLFEGIQRWSETKSKMTKDEIKDRAKIALKKEILYGTQYLRTHVDVTDPNLTCLKAIMELKEEVKDLVDIQIIAFPQEGMYSYKDGDKLVEEALKMGADVVGAIPHFEFTREMGEKSVKKTVELAMKYNKLIDIHCDETDDEQSRFLELLAAEAYMNGIEELTTASHACAMGSYNNAYTFKLFKLLALSKINFISCPTENIHLQGRYDTYPKRRGLTRVKELNDAGINVCFAQDSISDPWYPLGNGNLMNILDAGIHICQMMSFEEIKNALDLITVNGAKTLHIQDKYGIEKGKDANFIVLNAKDEFDAILERVGVNCSVRKGEFLFKRAPEVIDTKISLLK